MSILDISAPEWMDEAGCANAPPEAFFPPVGNGNAAHVNYAKAICARCDVSTKCLAYATADPSIVGVWGGTTEHERKKLRAAA